MKRIEYNIIEVTVGYTYIYIYIYDAICAHELLTTKNGLKFLKKSNFSLFARNKNAFELIITQMKLLLIVWLPIKNVKDIKHSIFYVIHKEITYA